MRSFLIGETSLLIRCAEILLQRHLPICGIISPGGRVADWAKARSIPCISSGEEILPFLSKEPFDYLFSIVNSAVLPPEVLRLPGQCAINYHDGPLPRYAGVHATSWALLNRERSYAISWHVVEGRIDAGDIVKQWPVTIEDGETAFTLNAKCYAAAAESFDPLAGELASRQLLRVRQDPTRRTYFSRHRRPPAAGVISWDTEAEAIDALVRALSFGEHAEANALGLAKVKIRDDDWLLPAVELLPAPSTTPPGCISQVHANPACLDVSTRTRQVRIHAVRTLCGAEVSLRDVIARYGLAPGDTLACLDAGVADRINRLTTTLSRHEPYWVCELARSTPLQLPWASVAQEEAPTDRVHRLVISKSRFPQLAAMPASEQELRFVTVLAIYLQRCTRSEALTLGFSTLACRCAIDGMTGLFADTVPLNLDLRAAHTFSAALAIVREQLRQVRQQATFLRDVVPRYPELRGINLDRQFPVTVVATDTLDHAPAPTEVPALSFVIPEKGDEFLLLHQPNRITDDQSERLTEHLCNLLLAAERNPESDVWEIEFLTAGEKELLARWNSTETPFQDTLTLIDHFHRQAETSPDTIAVVCGDETLTYRELNARANLLAQRLMAKGVAADCLVGIMAERSLEMVIGLLGILKAGAAYLPLDPDYPRDRLLFMIADAAVAALVVQGRLEERVSTCRTAVIRIAEATAPHPDAVSSPDPLPRRADPEHLAYVIYTSGTTGQPKGVMTSHRAILNRLLWMQAAYRLTAADAVLQKTPFSFDVSVWEFFWPLMVGARLVMAKPGGHKDSAFLRDLIRAQQITTLHFVPSMLQAFLSAGPAVPLPSVRQVMCSGEALSGELHLRFRQCYPKVALHNLYGPTEAAVDVTAWPCSEEPGTATAGVPIGRPISNLSIHILDNHRRETPIGVPGELCIAGVGLARGYLNRPELTAERFFDVTLQGRTRRVYATGDLARWRPDGVLEYLGRLDHQVKIRGFRVELSEIEVNLRQHPLVCEAVVTLHGEADLLQLAAYVTLAADQGSTAKNSAPLAEVTATLREWLRSRLPEHMIPASFTVLDKLPLSVNGKVDRKALPAPDRAIRVEYLPPQTATERRLCELWSQLLRAAVTSAATDFFASGGHSLLATQLLSRIHENFGVEMPFWVVFKWPVLRDQAAWLDRAREAGSGTPDADPQRSATPGAIPSLAEDAPRQLSFAQHRLWFLDQLDGQSATYNMLILVQMDGPLDEAALSRALTALVARHESLRMTFPAGDGRPVLRLVEPYAPLTVAAFGPDAHAEAVQHLEEQARIPFDISREPLFRARLCHLGGQRHLLLFTLHHIICDGWSLSVLLREWGELYSAEVQERTAHLAPLPIRYTDYAAWQKDWLQGERLDNQLHYWRRKLGGAPELLDLPADFVRPAVMSYHGRHYRTALGPEFKQGLRALGQSHGATDFMCLLAVFHLLLYRYSGQADLLVGTPIANRNHPQAENLVGFLVNTLVQRATLRGDMPFTQLLEQVKQNALEAYTHQDIPFEYLVERLNPTRSASHSPLFQVMFVLQNTPPPTLVLAGGPLETAAEPLRISFLEPENHTAKFDLLLDIAEHDDGFACTWEYRSDLFRPETIAGMSDHFRVLLEEVIRAPEQPLARVRLLRAIDREQLQAWNRTASGVPGAATVLDFFAAHVRRTPERTAVIDDDRQLSYGDLDRQSQRLAHALRAVGVGPGKLAGICMDRSPEMVIGLLAILKAGAAYVPLDPDYPAERIRHAVADAALTAILSQAHLVAKLPAGPATVIPIESVNLDQTEADSGPFPSPSPDDPLYVIYTSGSTGRPKGVVLPHRALANLIHWQMTSPRLAAPARTLQFTSLNFDVSAQEIFGALSTGGILVLVSAETRRDPDSLLAYLARHRVERLYLPFVALEQLATVSDPLPALSLRDVITAGEQLKATPAIREFFRRHGDCRLHNHYGPTESHVVTSCELAADGSTWEELPPIGKPIANTEVHVLDELRQPVPPGIPGELYIGGRCLATGYLNDAGLTGERFIAAELCGCPQRLYRTGDRCRWRPDGQLAFLGRIDTQIKFRGIRIEPGEIEVTLTQHEAVREAAVVLDRHGDSPRLVAYLTCRRSLSSQLARELRAWLSERLPDHMIPSPFVELAALPVTANGKTDRRALESAQGGNRHAATTGSEPPRTENERVLAALWQDLLGVGPVGRLDNFFHLGGHSLLATQLLARIQRTFPVDLSLRELFDHPTIAELTMVVERSLAATPPKDGPTEREEFEF